MGRNRQIRAEAEWLRKLRKSAKSDTNERFELLRNIGAHGIIKSYRKKTSLKDFYSSMRRLELLLNDPALKSARDNMYWRMGFQKANPMKSVGLRDMKGALNAVKKAFRRVAYKSSAESKIELFESVEMMRMRIGSDMRVVLRQSSYGPLLLISSLIANMRQASLENLARDKHFMAFAENARENVARHLPELAVEDKLLHGMRRKFSRPQHEGFEYTGGAKIRIRNGKPLLKISFINPESFLFDNPVLIKPLMSTKSDLYLHTHPGFGIPFTTMELKRGRWNLDIETSDALGLPFLLFNGTGFFIYNKGKITEVKREQQI